MPSLNHSRRAPPPPPLIRVINPNGVEKEGKEVWSSSGSSLSGSTLSLEEDEGEEERNRQPQTPCNVAYFYLRVRWLKGSLTSKLDKLPLSVSSRGSLLIETPPRSASLPEEEGSVQEREQQLLSTCLREIDDEGEDRERNGNQVSDWTLERRKLPSSSLPSPPACHRGEEILLFFQPSQDASEVIHIDALPTSPGAIG